MINVKAVVKIGNVKYGWHNVICLWFLCFFNSFEINLLIIIKRVFIHFSTSDGAAYSN